MSTTTTSIRRFAIAGLAVAATSAAVLLPGATSTAQANPYCDAKAQDPAAVHVSGFYQGNNTDEIIIGGNGDDTIHGGGGDDLICAGRGNDTLVGGSGADQLEGEPGDDTLEGGYGNDTLAGELGNDTHDGGPGNDWCLSDANDVAVPVNCTP